ncbi:glutamate 5-kinase [Paenactinomyces guangxiensis]|uniref:Glutamate 5-kinase n=1 Tax=Paenactinomyces guangxiensis TaxID=1490290 RepID=A0A7W2AAD9_9BACL|nr:glutamate 5-kinase [Paenactinomyces guangxiensis]MBA4496172.1 glutamate 5-kinase [Paenactinomyces guangxiensis]MBH8593261.1 glutamate 5-kinase [Paenactinomyces guangxiensis]
MEQERIVVKVGSSSLTDDQGCLAVEKVVRLVRMIAGLQQKGYQVILVSSGGIAAGLGKLGWDRTTISMPEKQAAAAVGQGLLIQLYERLFAAHGLVIGQLLLTRADIQTANRLAHIRNTMETLLVHSIVPVINENDTVAVEEIRFGDNDTLSSLVAVTASAQLLVLLTDIDGMYTSDPRQDKQAKRIHDIWKITDELEQMAGANGTPAGTGGMRSKLAAAKIAMDAGIDVVVASSFEPDVLERVVAGEAIGTRFHGQQSLMKEAR